MLQRREHHYPKLDFTKQELQERFNQQLETEQACTVTIDSVENFKPVTENMANVVNTFIIPFFFSAISYS